MISIWLSSLIIFNSSVWYFIFAVFICFSRFRMFTRFPFFYQYLIFVSMANFFHACFLLLFFCSVMAWYGLASPHQGLMAAASLTSACQIANYFQFKRMIRFLRLSRKPMHLHDSRMFAPSVILGYYFLLNCAWQIKHFRYIFSPRNFYPSVILEF